MGRLTKRVINQVKKTKLKKKKQTMKKKSFKTRLLSFAAFCGLTLAFASCANEDVAQNPNNTDNDKNLTTFTAGDPSTRTSMESDGKFFWEAGDKIWVKDDDGTWQQSSNTPTAKTASFKFKVPGKYTQSNTYKVYYPGKNGNRDKVTISASQRQAEPNTTAHFGAVGDCGIADAAWSNSKNGFAFSLDHKAAYLLFLPRNSNTILQNCYLTKVEVSSDNDITSTYTLDPSTGKLTGTGTGKQIVLTTQGSGTYANGFPLNNTSTSAATNGSYVVIKPGTHTLKIRYWVKDMVTNVEGTITKSLSSATYDQNKYYNITANLNIKDYSGDHYYMWDAQDQYWKGHEWNNGGSQPTINYGTTGSTTSNDYAKNNTDSRYYNEAFTYYADNKATHTPCKDLPNVNEMIWYAEKGDPHWDNNELWTLMGHLYKGGMWFKKKAFITGYNKNTAYNGYDWRIDGSGVVSFPTTYTPPSPTNIDDYFFLPALGHYVNEQIGQIGTYGYYWSSSAYSWIGDRAYGLYFVRETVSVGVNSRHNGLWVGTFE